MKMRLIGVRISENGLKKSAIWYEPYNQEYVVRFFQKHRASSSFEYLDAADYYDSDKQSAEATADRFTGY